jgi:NADPH:quinone reductase-like Zn-dependent oxidoreductase
LASVLFVKSGRLDGFTPGGICVGVVQKVGRDVWLLEPGQRVLLSSLFVATENVPDPARVLIGITSFGGVSEVRGHPLCRSLRRPGPGTARRQ